MMRTGFTFDRTYEGLKLGQFWAGGDKSYAFDRTYEGLKPLNVPLVDEVDQPLLTVPMRV